MALVHQLSDGFTSQVYRCCSDEIGVKEIVCNRVPGHSLVMFGSRKTACMVCRDHGKWRLDGKSPKTVYGCDTCQVNLCQVSWQLGDSTGNVKFLS